MLASDVRDAVRIEHLRGMRFPYFDANPISHVDLIHAWEDVAQEIVGDMRQRIHHKWACRKFPHHLASGLKAD